jgi:phospholipid transport system transporter-binding protein
MASRAAVSASGDTLALSGVLDYESVLDVEVEGRQWLQGAAPAQCKLDLAAVSYSSSAGVALLLGWLRVARQQRKSLQIQNMPADMAALVQVSGLADILLGV